MNDSERRTARLYLLGELSEAESDRLEIELLTDGEASQRMAAWADDLIDDYVAGRLARSERIAFERRLRASSRLRRRTAFARSLARAVREASDTAATVSEAAPEATVTRWPGRRSAPRWSRLAAAATVVLGIGCGWLLWRSESLRHEVLTLQAARQEASARLTTLAGERQELETRSEQLDRDLTAERAAAAAARRQASELEAELEAARSTIVTAPPVTASFVLSPALRSELGARRFQLPTATDRVRLTLELGADEGFASYLAVLNGPDGGELWSDGDLTPQRGGTAVEIELPAELLRSGRHEVLLYGVTGDDTGAGGTSPELVGAFELDLERR